MELSLEVKYEPAKASEPSEEDRGLASATTSIQGRFPMPTLRHCHLTDNPEHQKRMRRLKDGLLLKANVFDNYPVKFRCVLAHGPLPRSFTHTCVHMCALSPEGGWMGMG